MNSCLPAKLAVLPAALLALLAALFHAGRSDGSAAWMPGRAQADSRQAWMVTTNADVGPGSLRQALLGATAGDAILFSAAAFPPRNPVTIALASPLPAITQANLALDASNAGVILDGSAAGEGMIAGLSILANGVQVRGLLIVHFSGCGLEIRGWEGVFGGDRRIGSAPTGQGNLLSGNGHSGVCLFEGGDFNTIQGNFIGADASGVSAWPAAQGDGVHINGGSHNTIAGNVISANGGTGLHACCSAASAYNTIRENRIGVGADGVTPLPNGNANVVIADGANHNTIGPGNVIAGANRGIAVEGSLSPANSILGNSIYGNLESGILLWHENIDLAHPPSIAAFDLASGEVSGVACPNCLVQIYSDEDNKGRLFEGQATADASGAFAFAAGRPLAGPHLTATATDATGATSAFSVPTSGSRSVPIQAGNAGPFFLLSTLESSSLADNRIGFLVQDQTWLDGRMVDAVVLDRLGVKRARGQMNEGDPALVDWQADEYKIHANFDQMISGLQAYGIQMTYNLIFWDKQRYRETGQITFPRFQSEEEILRWLDFVRYMVRAFGDRVDYWELWNEPNCYQLAGCFPVQTYIEVGQRVIEAIRQEDSEARIVIPSYHAWDPPDLYEDYLYKILTSELMPLVDVIAWHPFIVHLDAEECGGEFFDRYWNEVLPEIKSLATSHGFQGEFRADELSFKTRKPNQSEACAVFDRTAGKYYLREIIHHLGEGVAAGIVMNGDTQLQVLQSLGTLMAGAQPAAFPVVLGTSAEVIHYTFSLPGGGRLIALWNDAPIANEDNAVQVTLRLPGIDPESRVFGADLLSGVQQPLQVTWQGEELVFSGLMVREYPLFIRLLPLRRIFLPGIRR